MSCNTPIFRAVFDSATLQNVAANGIINLPEVTTTSANCVNASGGVVTIRKPGTYMVHVNVTVSAAAAGAQEIQLLRNGTPVAGAHALETAAAAADLASMAFAVPITVPQGSSTTLAIRTVPAANIRVANMSLER